MYIYYTVQYVITRWHVHVVYLEHALSNLNHFEFVSLKLVWYSHLPIAFARCERKSWFYQHTREYTSSQEQILSSIWSSSSSPPNIFPHIIWQAFCSTHPYSFQTLELPLFPLLRSLMPVCKLGSTDDPEIRFLGAQFLFFLGGGRLESRWTGAPVDMKKPQTWIWTTDRMMDILKVSKKNWWLETPCTLLIQMFAISEGTSYFLLYWSIAVPQ